MNKKIVYGAIALTFIVAVLALVLSFGKGTTVVEKLGAVTTNLPSLGVARLEVGSGCGDAFTSCTGLVLSSSGITSGLPSYFASSSVSGGVCSVSTASTTATLQLTVSNLTNCSLLSITSGTSTALTVTMPASSTMSTITNSGDSQGIMIYSASTTGGTIVFAATTSGFSLMSPLTLASTTAATTTLNAGKVAQLNFVRLPTTDVAGVLVPAR